jgi:predicted nucleic acid-binding Zn ribbon protein
MAGKQPEKPARQQPDQAAPAEPAQDQDIDAAQAMLNRMREAAAARGEVRLRPGTRRRTPAADGRTSGGNRGGQPKYESGRDPQGLGTVFNRLVRDRGWNSPVAVGSVISRWDELVGPDIAAHCRPESFQDTTVQVRCDSTAWATQLRLLSSALLARFDEALGAGVVTKIQVLAPAAPNWRKGPRTVSGRGPRDTYG